MKPVEEKKKMRREIMQLKNKMTDEQKELESRNVCNLIEADKEFQDAACILAYWSLADELDIRPLIRKWSDSKLFLLPKIVNKQLILIEYKGEDILKPEPFFGIFEPEGPPFTHVEKINLVIVPGMAFDAQGFRLGRGGGYYDRTLPKLVHAVKIGVGFSFQMVSSVPYEPHDEVLDKVIVGYI